MSGSLKQIDKTGPFSPTAQDLFSFINNHTEKDSVIIFFKPRVMRLFTNRKSILIENKNGITRGDYLCLQRIYNDCNQIIKNDLDSLLKDNMVQLIFQNVDFQFYRIKKT